MQRIILTIALLFIIMEANSQSIVVKGFRKIESDQDARIYSAKTDQNGKKCAIIKAVTSQTGFVFDFGGIGNAVATEQKTGEIWVWVPAGARKVTISHQQLGVLRNYPFDIDIEEATVYEMVLTTGTVTTIVDEQIVSQWLVIKTDPADAMIYIDNQFVKNGEYQAKLKPGSYTYRVEAPLYHTDAGKLKIVDSKKELNVKLKPAFGYLTVTSEPEQDAKVIIDGRMQLKTTPCQSEAFSNGEHTVQVVKEMFQPQSQKVTVIEGQTFPVNFILLPNFAEVSITAPNDATIYINNQQKGIGSWKGRLNAGIYSLEARKDKHRSAKQDIEVKAGDKRSIEMQPSPIYGTLDVITSPIGSEITINGKAYGATPNTVNKLLIGDYNVQLSKQGYATVIKSVTISEGKNTEVSETLINGRAVTINSTPSGAALSIDDNVVGQTPYSGSLTFGSHTMKIEQDGKKAEKTITISQTGGETSFTMNFGPEILNVNIKGVNIEMTDVKGGTFQMGSPENDFDKGWDENLHQVTVSDFLIGKYEVTQAQWKAVMDNNPSTFKGDNLPVETISWEDVQEFLQKINAKTGKNYRLPTEAEWEYAARGGNKSRSFIYAGSNTLENIAWFINNSNSTTHPVGIKQPNELGLYDMAGNVCEWCDDWYDMNYYVSSPRFNPTGPSSGKYHVLRGGCWDDDAIKCRTKYRYVLYRPNMGIKTIGLRLVCSK